MDLAHFDALSFDCYGTLIDWTAGMLAALVPLAGDRAESLLGAYHRFEPQVEATEPHLPYRSVLAETLRRAAALERMEPPPAGVLAAAWPSLQAFPEVPEALGALRRAGWRLAVLTNCDDDLFASTSPALGLELDAVVTAEQVRSYKPRLAHFDELRRRTRADPTRWVHVGASWPMDMVPAHRLGLPRIWIDRDASGYDPTLATAVTGNLAALPSLIDSL